MGCAATLHSFGRPKLVANPKMPEVAHRPSPSPPCAIPHRRALRILQLPRLLLLGAFQARAGQTRETQDGRSRCTADGPAPSSNPHQHRLIASASFGGTVHQQKLKAWLKRENFLKRSPQA